LTPIFPPIAHRVEVFQLSSLSTKVEKDSLNKNKEIGDHEIYWKNFKGHYKEAAIFRILRNKGKDKLYAGFDEYVSLSSGIVRLFMPRTGRLNAPGMLHHMVIRGIEKKKIFRRQARPGTD
jgi:hypothetical protein